MTFHHFLSNYHLSQKVQPDAAPTVFAPDQYPVSAPPALSPPTISPPVVLAPAISSSSSGALEVSRPLAQALRRKRRLPLLGADFDYFVLLDSKTRRQFGGSMLDLSPGIGGAGVDSKGSFDFDLSLLGNSKRDGNAINNKFSVVFAGVGFSRPFGAYGREEPVPPLLPFYGASVGAIYANLNAPGAGVKGSAFGATGSVFLGASLRDRVFVEARLRGATNTKGFNFSGVGLSLGVRF